jgi:Rap1a immunity proteins
MKTIMAALVVCCPLLAPLEAHATSANELLQLCREMLSETKTKADGHISFPLTFGNGLCWGFFDAFRGLSRLQSDKDPTKTIIYVCAPPETTLTRLAQTFIEYVEINTQRLNDPAEVVVLLALNKAYPCQ